MSNANDHLSERELAAMTSELDQLHNDHALPAMRQAIDEWSESLRDSATAAPRARSRRTFLLGAAGVGAGGLVLAACGSSSPKATTTSTTMAAGGSTTATTGPASGALTGDLQVAATAASLENLGIFAYKSALSAATAGKLGKVPPAIATFAMTAMRQHTDHAAAWNSALTSAGKSAVTATDPALTPTVQSMFAKVTNVSELAQLALLIENIAAQTYQSAIPVLTDSKAVAVAATIHPVEMQHAAILYYALGRYPGIQGSQSGSFMTGSPLAFNPTALARPAGDYKAA